MDQREIELKLKTALEHAVPDVKEQILQRCAEEHSDEERLVPMDLGYRRRRRRYDWSIYVAAAAVLLLLVNIGGGWIKARHAQHTETVIYLDVNPSVALEVNADNRVITATAVNSDAEIILQNMNLSGSTSEVAVNAVLGSMLKHGYLDDNANSILLTVDNKDEQESRRIEMELVQDINETLQSYSVEAAILSQAVTADIIVEQTTSDYEISRGRTILIQKIIDNNPYYTFEELSQLTINELNLLLNSQRVEVQTVNTVGVASEKSYIGQDIAVEIVLLSSGISRENVEDMYADIDVLDARMVYGVSFLYDGMIHSFEVDALTGSIIANVIEYPLAEDMVTSSAADDMGSDNSMEIAEADNGTSDETSGTDDSELEDILEPSESGRESGSVASDNVTGDAGTVSDNTVPDNTESDNQFIDDEEKDTVSDNSVSENSVSGNEISGRMESRINNQYEGKYIYNFIRRCGIPADADLLWMVTENQEDTSDREYSDEWIKPEQALALVLAHTQLKSNDITCTLTAVYEQDEQYYYMLEFETKTHAYQYILDALTGTMIEYEKRLIR